MAIKNYTTTVSALKTAGQIQEILVNFGVKNISIDYFMNEPDAVRFTIEVYKNQYQFHLPCNPHGVLETMKRDGVPKSLLNLPHARKVSWRIIKDWLHAQLAIIDSGQASVTEVFFPYLLESSGQTIFQKFENSQLQLTE